MIDFLWLVITAPAWLHIILLGCAVAVYLQYGIRALTAPSAWVAFALFFVWVAASNSWHLLPKVDPSQFETQVDLEMAWNIWSHNLRETLIVAYLCAAAVSLGAMAWMIWGAYIQTVRFTMLTALYGFTVFVTQAGEAMQRFVCSANSPDLGREYLFWAAGEGAEGCGRLFRDIFEGSGMPWAQPIGEFVGPLFFPALTAVPPLIILCKVWRKRRIAH